MYVFGNGFKGDVFLDVRLNLLNSWLYLMGDRVLCEVVVIVVEILPEGV